MTGCRQVLRPARVISCSEPEEPPGAALEPSPGDGSPPAKRARRRAGPRAERGRRPRPATASVSSPPPPPPPAPPAREPAPPVREPEPPAEQEPDSDRQDPEPVPWSREEDLEILTSCQQGGDGEETFGAIQRRLPRRSLTELQARFQRLMEMLRQTLQQEPDQLIEDDLEQG